jgi:ribosomal RNA-processing protein 12
MATLVGFAMDDPIASLHAKHARSAQPESKQVCVVAEAIAEILRQENIAPSPTAVFAAVMSSLERAETSASPEVSTAMLVVLATALEHAPAGPVLTKLPDCVKVLLASGRAFQEHPPALRGVVQCIGLLVAALRDAPPPANDGADGDWSHLQKAFSAVCNLCVDSRPKVRKQAAASAEAALRVLRGTPYASHASACFAKVAVATARAPAKAARDLAEMHGSAGAKAAERRAQAAATECLHLLGALKRTLRELEEPAAGETASAVAALLSLGEPLLTQHACDALMSLFAQTGAGAAAAAAALAASARTFGKGSNDAAAAPSASEACRLAAKTAAAAIAPLASAAHAEAARRPMLAVSLVRAHAAAVRRLHELDPAGAGGGALPAAAHELVKMLNSVHEGVAMEAGACLSSLVTRCVDANMVREGIKAMATARAAGRAAPTRPPPVVGVANALRASLGFRYRAAWPIALPVVAAAFDRLGPAAGPILGGCLEALGEMGAHGEGLQCRGQLTLCLSAAVKALGPEQVLSVLPLRLEEGVDAEIAAIRNGRSNGFDRDGDDAMETDAPGAELDENGGNVAGAAGARLWLVPLLRQALRGETASHTTPFAWCTPFLKDFSRRHSSPALPFQCLTGKTFD